MNLQLFTEVVQLLLGVLGPENMHVFSEVFEFPFSGFEMMFPFPTNRPFLCVT